MAKDLRQVIDFDTTAGVNAINVLNKAIKEHNLSIDKLTKIYADMESGTSNAKKLALEFTDAEKKLTVTMERQGAVWRNINKQMQVNVNLVAQANVKKKEQLAAARTQAIEQRKIAAQEAKEEKARLRRIKDFERELDRVNKTRAREERIASKEEAKRIRHIDTIYHQSLRRRKKLADKAAAAARSMNLSWGAAFRILEVQLLYRALHLATAQMSEAAHTAKDLSIAIGEIQTITYEATITSDIWVDGLRKLSDLYGSDILDVTRSAYEALSNQIGKSIDVLEYMTEVNKLSVIAQSSLEDAVNVTSGVINSFNYDISDTAKISAILFKSVDLGKFRLDELSESLGRVSRLSHELGITFTEQQAVLDVMTIQGLKISEAMTYYRNVMIELIKPSEAMQAIFEKWGVTSGQAAIAAYGFFNVMRMLNEEAVASGDRLAELGKIFNEIRGLVGAITTTGAWDQLEMNLEQFRTAQEDSSKALADVLETDGKKIDIALNEIKNLFTVDYAISFNKSVVSINETIGGFANRIEDTIIVMRDLAATVVIWYTIKRATELYTVSLKKLNTALHGIKLAQSKLAATSYVLKGVWSSISGFVLPAVIFGIVSLVDYLSRADERLEQFAENQKQLTLESATKTFEAWRNTFQKINDEIDEYLTEQFRAFYKATAEIRSTYSKTLKELEKVIKTTSENIKNTFSDSVDDIKKNLNEFKRQAEDAQRQADRLKQQRERSKYGEYERRVSFELEQIDDPIDKAQLLEDQIAKLKDHLQRAVQAGNVEQAEEFFDLIDSMYDRLEGLQQDREKLETKFREKSAKEEKKAQEQIAATQREIIQLQSQGEVKAAERKFKQLQRMYANYRDKFSGEKSKDLFSQYAERQIELNKQLEKLEKKRSRIAKHAPDGAESNAYKRISGEINRVKTEMEDIQKDLFTLSQLEDDRSVETRRRDNFRDRQEFEAKMAKEKEAQAKAEAIELKEREKSLETLSKSIEEIHKFGETGEDALANYDKLLKQAEEAAKSANLTEEQRLKIFEAAWQKRVQIAKQAELQMAQDRLNVSEQELKTAEKALEEQRKQRDDALIHFNQKISESTGDVQKRVDLLRGAAGELRVEIPRWDKSKMKEWKDLTSQFSQASKDVESYNNQLAKGNLTEEATLEIQKKRQAALEILHRLFIDMIKFEGVWRLGLNIGDPFGPNLFNDEGEFEIGGTTLEQMRTELATTNRELDEARDTFIDANKKLGDISAIYDEMALQHATLAELFGSVATAAEKSGEREIAVLDRVMRKRREHLELLRRELELLRRGGGGGAGGVGVQRRASGGAIGFPGSPRGTDRIPVWLSPGEYVWDARTTRQFYPIIRALHTSPKHMASGGPVTNVGDINVTVHGGDTSETTVRNIASQLRREIRRGTVRLN